MKMKMAPTRGAMVVAEELKMPQRLMRHAPFSGGPEDADVGIDRDLQQREAAADDEEREEEERIGDGDGGWNEEEEPGRHDTQRGDDAGLVADAADDPAAGQRHDEVGAEEAELHQEGEDVGEVEEVLEVGNEDVVERGDEADAEVERHHQDHGQDVAAGSFGANGGACVSSGSNSHA